MYHSFDEMRMAVRARGNRYTLAVAVAEDSHVLESVRMAYDEGVADSILVGNCAAIQACGAAHGIDLSPFAIVDADSKEHACEKAVALVAAGEAQILMKGLVDSAVILRAVLNRASGLCGRGFLSHVGVYKLPDMDHFLLVTDSSLNILPNREEKIRILENAVVVAHALGNDCPKAALLCAAEQVSAKMPATQDAAQIAQMVAEGRLTGCVVAGPLALDNAISAAAAMRKGIVDPVAGHADILVVPNIESGNVLVKSLIYFGKAELGGIIMGAKNPIVLTSRASSAQAKLNAIVLSSLLAAHTTE